jgi:hypothetical protein
MTATAAKELDPKNWRTGPGDTVMVSDVVRTAGVPHGAIDYPIRLGLVPIVAREPGRRGRYITRDDAVMLLAAAALAVAAGVALAAIVRAIRATQATVTPAGLVIPVAGAA